MAVMMRRVQRLALLALAALLPAGLAAQDDPAPPDKSQDLAWNNQQMAALAALNARDGWSWLEGGLMWRRTRGDGSGVHPTLADRVTVNYEGRLVDGTVFDSTAGGQPVTFPLGRLIKAWQLAIPMAGKGDTIEIAVPASLGYGFKGAGPIPGGATMFFTIELVDVPGK